MQLNYPTTEAEEKYLRIQCDMEKQAQVQGSTMTAKHMVVTYVLCQ